jgi:hypothetical protein
MAADLPTHCDQEHHGCLQRADQRQNLEEVRRATCEEDQPREEEEEEKCPHWPYTLYAIGHVEVIHLARVQQKHKICDWGPDASNRVDARPYPGRGCVEPSTDQNNCDQPQQWRTGNDGDGLC